MSPEDVGTTRRAERGRSGPRAAAALLCALAILPWAPGPRVPDAAAHGGYPMSLGALKGSGLEAVTRLLLVYLREGQGMTVEPLFFATREEMEAAFGKGRADLLVDSPPRQWARENCPPGGGEASAAKVAEYFRARHEGSWAAAFTFRLPSLDCPPALVAHPRVAGDLRFTLLRSALERIVTGLGDGDVARLLREGGGDARAEVESARRILGEKRLL